MNILQLTTTVLGGLALFIYGMGLMSEGLTQIAGARMKAVLGYVTRNRVFAILAGAGVTALIQSSSATTVMTVGFVNAGLLSLQQAIGVVFGANIGTTMTGQLVSFNLADIALPAVVVGVAGTMAARRLRTRAFWRAVLGFGLLFFGMNMMSHELKSLAKLPEFVRVFSVFDCAPSAAGYLPLGSVLGAIAVGTLCTMVVQSSSATIGITIALAEAGLINIWTAVPIVLGDNIGTTVTAALAAIGTNANAKRTALAHALFNVIGTVLLVSTFPFVFANGAGERAPAFFHLVNASAEGDVFAGANLGRHVAMAHTLFNVTNVVVLAFFIPLLARICERLIGEGKSGRTVLLEPHLLASPELALHAATLALGDMTRRAWTVASAALATCLGKAAVDADSIENAENGVDATQADIRAYLIQISQRSLTDRQACMIPEVIHCVNDAERISDLALRVYRKTNRVRGTLPADVRADVAAVIGQVRLFAHATVEAIKTGRPIAEDPVALENAIHTAVRKATRAFSAHLHDSGERTEGDLAVLAVFSCLRDISRHLGNIATRIPGLW